MTDTQPTPTPNLNAIQTALTVLGDAPWYTDDFEIHSGHPDDHTIDTPWIGETCNVELPDHGRARAEAIVTIHNALPALIARIRDLETEQTRLRSILTSTQQLAELDSVTCLSCGHLESAHDPDGDRDCTASGAQVISCSCQYFIPCYPAPVPVRGDR